ncbi:hypothetical protein TNCV_4919431 [Trichonephila clavipes]|nr:hypothetical protein TNCV_4919431 [Trichonephila clavipes]
MMAEFVSGAMPVNGTFRSVLSNATVDEHPESHTISKVPSYQEDFDTLRMDLNHATINRSNTGQRYVGLEVIPDGITHTVVYTEELVNSTDSNLEEIMDSHINRT